MMFPVCYTFPRFGLAGSIIPHVRSRSIVYSYRLGATDFSSSTDSTDCTDSTDSTKFDGEAGLFLIACSGSSRDEGGAAAHGGGSMRPFDSTELMERHDCSALPAREAAEVKAARPLAEEAVLALSIESKGSIVSS